MKFFVVLALIATVASATYLKPTAVSSGELAQIQEVIAAIQSPNTDPATAAALLEMLHEYLGTEFEPVAVGPAFVEEVAAGPAIVAPTPVVDPIAPEAPAAAATPLVQIILNINQANADSAVAGAPAATPVVNPEAELIPTPVSVVEVAPEPVVVAEIVPTPVSVVEVAPEPVVVAEVVPTPVHVVEVESVAIGGVNPANPITPEVAVPMPEILN